MGSRLGRYVVLKHLASGGMADVLLGRADGIEGFERHVVLKRIRPEHAQDPRFIRMFLDEARLAANLHHQHIVQVHDIGEAAGELFISMEYIHGEDVRTLLSNASKTRAHVPLGVAVAIVSAAAAGLHYAHERRGNDKKPLGIVHRDISPSNILVGYDGAVKVVDFGIAKASMRQETRSGSLKGKISYMSPEQCKGADVDRRSDVYSLGVVLYELATTTRLFKGDNDYLVMDQIVNGRVSLPRVRRPDLPNELSSIIMRAIAPDPERRYFTADELRVALDQFAAKAGLTTSAPSIAAFLRKQFGERPEPWLDLSPQSEYSFSDDEAAQTGTPAGNSWTEMPRDDPFRRGSSSNVMARTSGPVPVAAAAESANDMRAMNRPSIPSLVPGASMSSSSPTESNLSKMGWESQARPPVPGGMSPAKVAMICGPLVVLLGIAVWRLTASGNAASSAAIANTQAAAAPGGTTAPVVTPIPDVPTVVADDTAGAEARRLAAESKVRAAALAASQPQPRRSNNSGGNQKIDNTPSSAPTKPELPAAAPASSAPVSPTAPMPAAAGSAAPSAVLGPTAPAPAPAPPPVTPPPAPTPAPAQVVTLAPSAPQNVTAAALEANRVSGDKEILPDESTQVEIRRSGGGGEKLQGAYKMCVNPDGSVGSVTQIKSTGFQSYDDRIQSTIRNRWRYKPYVVNGRSVSACTVVRFVYSQR
jgi:serine/threonine protein kinase